MITAVPQPLASTPAGDTAAMATAVATLIHRTTPTIIGLGEPTHGPQTFPRIRNALLPHLVADHGLRTVALESDAWAGRQVDAWVRGGPGTLEDVLANGFSHGFGAAQANRELLVWLRTHNTGRPTDQQVGFAGLDMPTEMVSTPSPRPQLEHLHRFLTTHLGEVDLTAARLDELLGPDAEWSDEAGAWDPSKALAARRPFPELRAVAGDLQLRLRAAAPVLVPITGPDAYAEAELAARIAVTLLAFHTALAGDAEGRWTMLGAVRDLLMADNATAIAERGPVLVYAHNTHLRRGTARMPMGQLQLSWVPTGAHLATRFGPRYLVVGTAAGRIPQFDIAAPEPDTVEGVLDALPDGDHLLDAAAVAPLRAGRPTRVTDQRHIPLDDTILDDLDALIYLRTG